MRRVGRVGSLGLASVALVLLSTVATASATQVGNGVCNSGNFCVYQNPNYGLSVADWNNGSTDSTYTNNEYHNTTTSINDRTSSTWNTSGYAVHLYSASNYGGQHKCYDIGEFTPSYGDFDNSASSHLSATGSCGAIGP